MPFKSLGAVSYSASVVTMAVSLAILEIFSVKELIDLEIWVRGPSRSLRMAPFDRPRMTLLVSHCNYSSILYHLTFNNTVILKYGLEVTQGHWNWCHSKAWVWFTIRLYSKYGRIFSHFRDILRQRMTWPWNVGLGLFKVIENGAVRQTMYDFLLVRHCNYRSILYHLRVIWR